jgi:ribosomal protein L37AE/L43A
MTTITIERPDFRWIHRMGRESIRVPVTSVEQWTESEYHCPDCGASPVYVEPGEGDYYAGPTYICVACEAQFTLGSVYPNELSRERATLIRAAVAPAAAKLASLLTPAEPPKDFDPTRPPPWNLRKPRGFA